MDDAWLDGLAFRLARSQHGLLSHAQAIAIGFRKDQIAYRVRTRRWRRLSFGVYELYESEPTFPWRAALAWLQLGDEAIASHRCAVILRNLDGASLSGLEFTTLRRRRKGRAGVKLHYVSELPDEDWTTVDGIPTTTVTRTIVDLACDPTVSFDELERVFESGPRRKETSHDEVRAMLDRRAGSGHRGTRRARRLVELLVDDGRVNHSEMETRFFQILRNAGLPLPTRQRMIQRADGRLAYADYAYDDRDGLIELVGFKWHSSSAALRSDAERSNEIQLQRKAVLQFTWEHVTKRQRYVVTMTAEARKSDEGWGGQDGGMAEGTKGRRRLVVIGGDAAGMSAASQARRLDPDLDIVALEKGRWTSYSACGIPYLVGGDVKALDDLIARDPQTFRTKHNIDARTLHEAMAIDLDAQKVEVRDHEHERTYSIGYDVLHIATGATPVRPALPGIEGEQVHGVQTLEHAADLLAHAENLGDDCKVVVVGGGYIGLEMAEAFKKRGTQVTVITRTSQPLGMFDADMGVLIADAIRREGIELQCGTYATAFEPGKVHTNNGTLDADLVVLGLGVGPRSQLAAEAGIATGVRGAISVDRRQRTNHDNVYSAGDCCESFHRLTGDRVYVALGTVANKQGRTAGTNIGGGYATFPGVIGTAVTKLCRLECARTGVNEKEATEAGFEFVAATIDSTTRAGYYPGAAPIKVKMLAEKRSGRLLGAQIMGEEGAAKRIDVIATALTAGMTVEEMTSLDLSYAPPFSPVWDPVLIAARKVAESL